ncbi:hypothetical protein EVAR_96781_1 [Eumeta japonica]|uniref:Uncharacterized protein n=1 Tax=Eumeta variegata TaxID=151549 RepID=A0A4C1WV00_EUMVA|nr:hypothetical protein EVAR_96781_1 [Eumeta japonica]
MSESSDSPLRPSHHSLIHDPLFHRSARSPKYPTSIQMAGNALHFGGITGHGETQRFDGHLRPLSLTSSEERIRVLATFWVVFPTTTPQKYAGGRKIDLRRLIGYCVLLLASHVRENCLSETQKKNHYLNETSVIKIKVQLVEATPTFQMKGKVCSRPDNVAPSTKLYCERFHSNLNSDPSPKNDTQRGNRKARRRSTPLSRSTERKEMTEGEKKRKRHCPYKNKVKNNAAWVPTLSWEVSRFRETNEVKFWKRWFARATPWTAAMDADLGIYAE